jgi:hypothetical protein
MSNQIFPRLLNQKEVASIIRKSEAWLERQRWLGEGIPYRKVGRNVLYDEADILAFLNARPKITQKSKHMWGEDNE